jgi:hypothetical protein
MPVYFIQAETGEIKIGYTRGDPEIRLRQFQPHSPCELTLLAAIQGGRGEEAVIHGKFRDHKLHHEWFLPAPSLIKFIEGEARRIKWISEMDKLIEYHAGGLA